VPPAGDGAAKLPEALESEVEVLEPGKRPAKDDDEDEDEEDDDGDEPDEEAGRPDEVPALP
jgi:hypothetical protein